MPHSAGRPDRRDLSPLMSPSVDANVFLRRRAVKRFLNPSSGFVQVRQRASRAVRTPLPQRGAPLLGFAAAVAIGGCGAGVAATASPRPVASPATATHPKHATDRVERVLGGLDLKVSAWRRLPTPIQDPATTAVAGHALLIGGARRADVPTSLVLAAARRDRRLGSLPYAVDDAAAATLAGRTYLIGGGQPAFSEILSVGGSGQPSVVGYLPVSASDVAAATVDNTVYVVGGFTGTRPLATIVAWSGSSTSRVVARLPHPLRSAAVAAADGRLVIAGGTDRVGATRDVYSFDPATGRVRKIALLPRPVTNAAAATLDGRVYVIGGRGTARGTQTAQITAIDPLSGRVWSAGRLPVALSDAGAAAVGQRLIAAGGRERNGALSDRMYVLRPQGGAA